MVGRGEGQDRCQSLPVSSATQVGHTGPSADAGLWDRGALSPVAPGSAAGGSFRFTFMQPGTYGYHCSIRPPSLYPGFVGIVVVKP